MPWLCKVTHTLMMIYCLVYMVWRVDIQVVVEDVIFAWKSLIQNAIPVDQLGQAVILHKHVKWSPSFFALKQLRMITNLHEHTTSKFLNIQKLNCSYASTSKIRQKWQQTHKMLKDLQFISFNTYTHRCFGKLKNKNGIGSRSRDNLARHRAATLTGISP